VLVETATRAYILRMWGFDPLEEFMKRHHEHMNSHGAGPAAAPAGDTLRKARNKVD
jgi:hypothetical protein